MPRPLVVGNGRLLVALDSRFDIRDLYWPYVGLYNHLSGHRARMGVWVDGRFSWVGSSDWERTPKYEPGTLATCAKATSSALGLDLTLQDCVHHREDILLRRVRIHNRQAHTRTVRVFLTHDLVIAETDIGDTAFYNPFMDAVVHYKRDHYFLVAARTAATGIHQYAMGIKGFGGAEGTWRDCEDGDLSMNPIAQGSVDSALSVQLEVRARRTAEVRAWLCAARSLAEASQLHYHVVNTGFDTLLHDTMHYWSSWSDVESERVARMPAPVPELFRRSLLTIRTNIDNRGAIIAANDSDIMETARAHYSYMWPRDGALVAAALDRLGYQDLTRRFFLFCRDVLPKDRAALLHKYSADKSWGATWHPWTVDGHHEIPFQEDSTALTVWALGRHYERYRDLEFIESLYRDLVLPCARFLADYRDPNTGLPLPSYDLWEERRGVHAYTCGTVYGALTSASALSAVFGDGHADEFRDAAQHLRQGILTHLWSQEAGRFVRMLTCNGHSTGAPDMTIDSAVHALHTFGAVSADDPRIEATMRSFITRLWVKTEVGGIARYENDYYFRRLQDTERVPGNPWTICTLWAAQWYVSRAHTPRDLTTALELILWASRHALPSGVLPEQVHPETGEPLSVAPLTWSHAEYVTTVLDYLDREDRLRSQA
ncbi:MAG TPA: glycoside hydrolase family 15 protein [Chthonomonadales bacterium]|nr:glycoside hydrolase family 15 protein [Chthonomonadales bacterium]